MTDAARNTPRCPYCFKDVAEDDTDHVVDDDGHLTECNVYGRTVA